MRAITILKSACEQDKEGNRAEALRLYEEGIRELLAVYRNESDKEKKNHYLQKINEYLKRAEDLKGCTNSQEIGKLVDQIHIVEGSTGYSYNKLFGNFLDETITTVGLEEPYLMEPFQYTNLIIFMELIVTKCHNLKHIMVTTKSDTKKNSPQSSTFTTLIEDLKKRNIELLFKFKEMVHDRRIVLSNGYEIKIGRGLHIYKPTNGRFVLGFHDYSFRECRDTYVDIYKKTH